MSCKICGLEEEEHHYYVEERVPPGCKCAADDWIVRGRIPPVCGKLVDDHLWPGQCGTCQHLVECHA